MDLTNLMKIAKSVENKTQAESVEAVSKGFRISLEYFGLILIILSFTILTKYWNIISFILGSFLYIRAKQLD